MTTVRSMPKAPRNGSVAVHLNLDRGCYQALQSYAEANGCTATGLIEAAGFIAAVELQDGRTHPPADAQLMRRVIDFARLLAADRRSRKPRS